MPRLIDKISNKKIEFLTWLAAKPGTGVLLGSFALNALNMPERVSIMSKVGVSYYIAQGTMLTTILGGAIGTSLAYRLSKNFWNASNPRNEEEDKLLRRSLAGLFLGTAIGIGGGQMAFKEFFVHSLDRAILESAERTRERINELYNDVPTAPRQITPK